MAQPNIQALALQTIQVEADSISALAAYINLQFEKVVQTIHQSSGRLVVSGIGKSAIIAQKMVATLNSTGTPSLYMHAADAIHGDLGMITPHDVVMLISKSGNSPEIKVLVPLIKNFGNTLIGMVGNMESFLAQHSHLVLNTTVEKEACPNNLAPTSSTTAQMVMGDALAVCLMHLNHFTGEDFARFHPGGTLGKQLFLRVSDLIANNPVPMVRPETPLPETVIEMTAKRLGATAVVNEDGSLFGVITDGDLRRMLERRQPIAGVKAADICTRQPKTIEPDTMAMQALDVLRQYDITHLVVTANNQYLGILHLHDLVKEGLH
ncbi:MAG: KpsF/GutQ family sugar-phosphate isomerase [Chitinophagaceae bacterium]|nr:KpsF/GutQ family sugar-phosphate isomerase [Chitinophagaceae bacterium]